MGEKIQTTSPLKAHVRLTAEIMHTPGEGVYQSCSKKFEILDFVLFIVFIRFR